MKKKVGGTMKKILLVTDAPPCRFYSGALLTEHMIRVLPKGCVVAFIASHLSLSQARTSEDLGVETVYDSKVKEDAGHLLPRKLGMAPSFAFDWYNRNVGMGRLVRKAVEFGRKHHVNAVWSIMQGQTMIRLGRPVAEKLGVPLYSQVWDDLSWWIMYNRIDPLSARAIRREYETAIRASKRFGAASWLMAESYSRKYEVSAVPIVAALDESAAYAPQLPDRKKSEFTIGVVGKLYATEEWNALLDVLDDLHWEIDGRKVVVRMLGGYFHLTAKTRRRIHYLGYAKQDETLRLMNECDITYCPYWFDPSFREVAETSFPSKLTTYLAAGRPVLFHGPEYCSPAKFLAEYGAGTLCHTLDKAVLKDFVLKLARDDDYYQQSVINGSKAFKEKLTTAYLEKCVREFLTLDDD